MWGQAKEELRYGEERMGVEGWVEGSMDCKRVTTNWDHEPGGGSPARAASGDNPPRSARRATLYRFLENKR